MARDVELQAAREGAQRGRSWRGLFVRFEVERTTKRHANKAKIEVANLSADSVRWLESCAIVRLLVDGVQLFAGEIRRSSVVTRREGATQWTTLESADGRAGIVAARLDMSFPRGASIDAAVRAACAAMGLPPRGALPTEGRAFDAPWAHSGRASDVLDEFCPGWSVQDGAVDFGGSEGRQTLLLREGTGLIGAPSRTDKGVKLSCVLAPSITPHSVLAVESRFVSGYFRATAVKHRGDSRGETWETGVECVQLA